MAERGQIPQMVEKEIGAGGPGLIPEADSLQIEVDDTAPTLPEGIELDTGEQMEVVAEPYNHEANLAEVLEDSVLASIASDLQSKVKEDLESRSDWEEAIAKGLNLLGINYEDRSDPFLGASGVTHPLLSEATTQFQSQAYKEMLPSGGPVKTQILGVATKQTEDQAQRVKERAISKFVPAEDLIVPYSASDIRTAERVTHMVRMSFNDIRKLQVAGVYKDVELSANDSGEDEGVIQETTDELQGLHPNYSDDSYTLLEVHVDLDLEGFEDLDSQGQPSGIMLPYIVTIDQGSNKVLSVVRNFREQDPLKRKRQYFVHFKFLPGFGFYGFGLLHTIGGLSRAATSILRQLIDAGTLSNLPAGFKARGVRIRNDDEPLNPGEFRDIDVPGGDLKNSIIPLPYKEPSGTLAQLLGVVVDSGRRFAQVADAKISDVNSQAPVGTTVALIEQGSKIISSIHKRLHYAQKQEFRMLAEIFSENPVPYPYFVGNVAPQIMQNDFDGRVDILPVSDPNIFSMSQRLSLAQTQLQLAQANPQIHNQYEAYRRMYDALDVKNIDSILPPPQPPAPVDPATENANSMKGAPLQVFPQQDHEAHLMVHAMFLSNMVAQANPQGFLLLQSHVQEHVSALARDQVTKFFQTMMQEAIAKGEQPPQIAPEAVEAAISQQIGEILKEIMPMIEPAQKPDPLVAIREKELENDTADLQRRSINDMMNFQIDSAKLAQAYELAQQRTKTQEQIAEDRNDVNIYRINTQASLKGR